MKLKTLMIIKAVVCLSFGFLFLVFPGQLYTLLGASLGKAGLFAAREYGAALIGSLLLTWYARDAGESRARRAIILDLFIYDAVGVIITLYAMLSGLFNWLGWGVLFVYLFFTIGYGYFWFLKPEKSESQLG
jgi:hypothetical protein